MKLIWKSRPELLARLIVSGLLLVLFATGCASKPMYRVSQVAFVTVNVADYATTQRALNNGARELNNWMPESPLGMAAFKAASMGLVLFLGDRLESRGKRAIATALLSAASIAIGLVANHNYKVGGAR